MLKQSQLLLWKLKFSWICKLEVEFEKSYDKLRTDDKLKMKMRNEAIQINEDDLEDKEHIDVLEIACRREQPTHANWA